MRDIRLRSKAALTLCAVLVSGAIYGCGSKKETAAPAPPPPAPVEQTQPKPPDTPAPVAPTRPQAALAGAVGIMVENSSMARPQAGLEKAELVYEMEAEYGITRFLALFYQDKAERVGPIRSARLGFFDVAVAYGLPYGHAGGNMDVLAELRRNKRLLDLDDIYTCGDCFWRISERQAPHNLYTSPDRLLTRAKEAGWTVKPLDRFPEGAAPGAGVAAAEIAFSWGAESQEVTWKWDGKRYQRFQSGGPHKVESGAQIESDNVVVLFTRFEVDRVSQPDGEQNNISIVGSGTGYLFRDGKVWPLKWTKGSREQHYAFTTSDGAPLTLAVGQTWIEVLKAKEHLVAGAPK